MSLAFYLDHHVPAAIADGLRQLQVDVLTVAEDRNADWDDERLLERALELGRIVFTQDRDFLVLAALWQQSRREFAGMVYGHQLRVTVGGAVRDIALIASVMTRAIPGSRVRISAGVLGRDSSGGARPGHRF